MTTPDTTPPCKLHIAPEYDGWSCYLFGNRPGKIGIIYRPTLGRVPNRFVRWMMLICFDCLWVKESK